MLVPDPVIAMLPRGPEPGRVPRGQQPGFRTLADHVESHAQGRPDRLALRVEGDALTYAELHERVIRASAGLAAAGVRRGQRVALLLPNCCEFVISWLALSRLGAVAAPLNTAFTSSNLVHAISITNAEILIADAQFRASLAVIAGGAGHVKTVFLRGSVPADPPVPGVRPWSALASQDVPGPRADVAGADAAMLLFTSGSTGRSKACVLPHRYIMRQAEIFVQQLGITDHDILFCPFPLFHADAAIFTAAPAFLLGTTAALASRFSVSRFWDQVRDYGATVFDFMGATLAMLRDQPPARDDPANPARLGWGVPLPAWAAGFEERFGVELVEVYGLSDAGIVLYNTPGLPRRAGSCGRPVAPFEVRILDPDGFELPAGELGEICIRPHEPDVIMTEYLGMPAETLRAFASLWFHTGDLGYRDDDGYFYFAGRSKDMIRRRGENISAIEIEQLIEQHPAVLEAAAFGVPSELTEEDVMVTVALRPGCSLTAGELLGFCESRLPRHMVPRYLDITDALPRTPTEKIEKHTLVAQGVTSATYDRESGTSPEPRTGSKP